MSTYTAKLSEYTRTFAGQDAEADEEPSVLVTFFSGAAWGIPACRFADFDAYIDIVAAFWALSVIGDEGEDTIVPGPLIIKNRRIIDEWGTVVKRKISLSFNGIIDIAGSAEGVERADCEAANGGLLGWRSAMTAGDLQERYRRR